MSRPRLYLSPYLDGDLGKFTPREDMRAELAACLDTLEGNPGRTWTLIRRGGQVLGVGGLVDRGGGLFDAWALLGVLGPRDWPGALWQARRILDGAFRFMAARRIDASARAINPGAAMLLRKLGFREVHRGVDHRTDPPATYIYMQKAA